MMVRPTEPAQDDDVTVSSTASLLILHSTLRRFHVFYST